MALKIRVPDSAYHTQSINLGGNTYNITFKYNTSDSAWYIKLSQLDGTPITSDIKVMPNQNLTGRFPVYTPLPNGNLWCRRAKNDFRPIDRNNFGIGKTYELVYLTIEEEIEAGIDGTVQL